jgi:glutaredoxin 3
MSKTVVVYSQPGCVYCGKAKEFLSQNKIEYTERNVAADKTALAELEKLGYKTTPVIVVDGEVVAGFDRAKLENLLLPS